MSTYRQNVYIATLPRSGSTMLGMMLGNHSDIFHIGESSYWGKINPRNVKCSCGEVGCRVLSAVYNRVSGSNSVASIYYACRVIDRLEEPEKICHELSLPAIGDNLEVEDVTNLGAKIESSCSGIEELAEAFRRLRTEGVMVDNTKCISIGRQISEREGWKVILLTRDPRGLAYSNKKSGIRKNVLRSVHSKIPVYLNFARKASELISLPNLLHVRYEDLCENPINTLIRIADFIGVSFEGVMLRFKGDRGHTLMGNRMRFDGNQRVREDVDWIDGLTKAEKEEITSNGELVSLFERLGYSLK